MEFEKKFVDPLLAKENSVKFSFNATRDRGDGQEENDRLKLDASVDLPMTLIRLAPTMGLMMFQQWKLGGGLQQTLETAHEAYGEFMASTKDPQALATYAMIMNMMTKDDIKRVLEEALKEQNKNGLQAAAVIGAAQKELVGKLDQHRGAYKVVFDALLDTMPTRTRDAYSDALFGDGKTIDDYLDFAVEMANDHSKEELTLMAAERMNRYPVDDVAEFLYQICQKATPEGLEAFFDTFESQIDKSKVTSMVLTGVRTAENVLTSAAQGEFSNLGLVDGVKEVHGHVKDVLQAVEDGLAAGDMLPEHNLGTAFRKFAELTADDLLNKPSAPKGPQTPKGPDFPKL